MDIQELLNSAIIVIVIAGIALVAMVVAGVYKGKAVSDNLKSDDNKPVVVLKGKVLEKSVENKRESAGYVIEYAIEWIVFEDTQGGRRRVRNVKPKEVFVTPGDIGELTLRGDTVYGFKRTVD